MKKYLSIILLICLMLVVSLPVFAQNEESSIKAKIVENKGIKEIAKENEPTKKVQNLTVRILEGEYENEEYEMVYVITEDTESVTSNLELKEDDNILVSIEEKEGEVTNISYIENINLNYTLYIIGAILIVLLLIVSRKRATILYLITITLVGYVVTLSILCGWNLILISSMLSFVITIAMCLSVTGLKKESLVMIFRTILGIGISGILIYILFDIIGLSNINIRITERFINIKDLIVSSIILFACGIYNAIMISAQYIFYANNKPYKTKSDNIIEGQRSLKL